MKVLNIYIVHYELLKDREKYINTFINFMKNCATQYDYDVKFHTFSNPSPTFVSNNIETLNKRVNYEKSQDTNDFDNLITSLNIHQISNIEIHREICKNIIKEDEYHFVVEDDIVINENYISNIEILMNNIMNGIFTNWDILFSCVADINNENLAMVPSKNSYKILLSKSSYFIKPSTAKLLYEYLETFKYNLKVAISKFIWDNNEIKSYVLNKHTFLEGTKIGIFTSSINISNFLYQNVEYVKLVNISKLEEISLELLKEVENIYESQKHLNNPDILHIMGIIYFKMKKYEKAKQFMYEACEKLEEGNGVISKNSTILNNAINMYKYEQDNLEEYLSKKSKYS